MCTTKLGTDWLSPLSGRNLPRRTLAAFWNGKQKASIWLERTWRGECHASGRLLAAWLGTKRRGSLSYTICPRRPYCTQYAVCTHACCARPEKGIAGVACNGKLRVLVLSWNRISGDNFASWNARTMELELV